jgi:hypothetical protein
MDPIEHQPRFDWSTDGNFVALAFDKKVVVWNANTATKQTEIAVEYTQKVRFAPDASWLMIAGYNGVTLNNTRDGKGWKSTWRKTRR